MGVGDSLRDFARFLEDCDGGTINGVEFTDRLGPEGELSAEVELTMAIESTIERSAATIEDDGRLRIAFESTDPVVASPDDSLDVDVTDVRLDSDGTVTVDLSTAVRPHRDDDRDTELSVEPVASLDDPDRFAEADPDPPLEDESERSSKNESNDGAVDVPIRRRRDVPPFEDRELLAEVYETCDTFSEMADAIGMDVTGETVRRYMIDHGIHTPNSYDTNGRREDDGSNETEDRADDSDPESETDADDARSEEEHEEPVVLPDGIGLPDGITVEAIIETVKQSNTIYEVEKNLDVDHETSLEMLREFDLLDLVVGRLATEEKRDIERAEIVERLRQNSASR